MTAAGAVKSRDFASIESALESVNELLLQINNQITSLNADNIATAGPALLQLGQNIQPLLGGFSQQIADSAPLTVDETNGLNTARTAFSKLYPPYTDLSWIGEVQLWFPQISWKAPMRSWIVMRS